MAKNIYKKRFRKATLIYAGSMALFLLICVLVLGSQGMEKGRLEKQLTEKKQLLDYAQQAAQQQTMAKLNQKLEDLRNSLGEFVIDSYDASDLTFAISQIAGEQKVDQFSVGGKNKGKDSEIPNCDYLSEWNVDVSFNGSFHQFAALMNALERNHPVIFVDGFSIIRSETSNSNHKAGMSLAVFVKKDS